MNAQGLLVEGPKGEKFLLTTEPHLEMKTHRMVVLQRINGKWERLDEPQGGDYRESLIGAFVDFIVDICRVLNSSGPHRVPPITPVPGRSQTGQLAVIKTRRP